LDTRDVHRISDKLLLQRQSGSSVFNFRLGEWVPNGFYWFLCNFLISFLFHHANGVRSYPKDNYSRSERRFHDQKGGISSRTGPILNNLSYIDSLPFDGITINIPATWGLLAPGNIADHNEISATGLARKSTGDPSLRRTSSATTAMTGDNSNNAGIVSAKSRRRFPTCYTVFAPGAMSLLAYHMEFHMAAEHSG
jgi:hypothetical protein